MTEHATADPIETAETGVDYPAGVVVMPALDGRNRLTAFFRFFLALPHIILVGGPIAIVSSFGWTIGSNLEVQWGSGTGILGMVAAICAVVSWFAILFTGRQPDGLWKLAAFYMRWRVRAVGYMTLLRDEYPPFGDDAYPVELVLAEPPAARDRVTVAFRVLLAVPHFLVLWLLGLAWAFTTAIAWVMIVVTARFPETLYGFAIGVMAWTARVEAYVLLLTDEYPPFTLRA
jgi:hypothetical protein